MNHSGAGGVGRRLLVIVALACGFGVILGVQAPSAKAISCTGTVTIGTANDLVELSHCASWTGGTFTLANDIDLSTETSPQDFQPIGDSTTAFDAVFDGNGKTISGLAIASGSDRQGLFGIIDAATIKDLTVAAPVVSGRLEVGSLVGVMLEGTIRRVTVTNAQVSGANRIGGLVGGIQPIGPVLIEDVRVDSATTGTSANTGFVGGLVGEVPMSQSSETLTIDGAGVTGSVTSPESAGGIIGTATLGNSNTTLRLLNVASTAAVQPAVGGANTLGGLIGDLDADSSYGTGQRLYLERTYAAGAVGTSLSSGGILGAIRDHAGFTLTVTPDTLFWDTQATGMAGPLNPAQNNLDAVASGKTTAQMQTLSTYTAAGNPWQMVSPWQTPVTGTSWGLCASVNGGYPFPLSLYSATPCAAPAAPSGISALPLHDAADISFTAPAAGDAPITDYEISIDGGVWQSALTATPSFTVAPLANGTEVSIEVRAVSAVGASPASAAVTVTPTSCTGSNSTVLTGAGTAADPYLVGTVADLGAVATNTCGRGDHYLQTADITMPATTTSSGIESNFTPIGMGVGSFTGTYDGGGHTITGPVYDDQSGTPGSDIGLFSLVGDGASIRDVHLRDVRFRGDTDIGGLAGLVDAFVGAVLIEDVSATGRAEGISDVGGLVGKAWVSGTGGDITIRRAEADVDVVGLVDGTIDFSKTGGLIGQLQVAPGGDARVQEVAASGAVQARYAVAGGLIGQVFAYGIGGGSSTTPIVIADASANGAVVLDPVGGLSHTAGGLIGMLWNARSRVVRVERSFSTGDVTARSQAGGLIGVLAAAGTSGSVPTDAEFAIVDAYASGDLIHGTSTMPTYGGLIGWATVTNASGGGTLALDFTYARGAVPATGKGIVGQYALDVLTFPSTVPTSYWDIETTGHTASGLPVLYDGQTSAEMRTLSTYQDGLGTWPMVSPWQAPASGRVWGLCASVNDGYPFLLAEYDATPCLAPAAPTGVEATAGDGRATITFTPGAANDAPITAYEISNGGGAWVPAGDATTIEITDMTNGTTYSIRVRSVSAVGPSPASQPVEVTPRATPTPDPGPTPDPLVVSKAKVLSGGRVQMRMRVDQPGVITVSGRLLRTRAGRATKSVCAAKRTVRKAGSYTLTCRLNKKTQRALRRKALRVRMTVAFKPKAGARVTETSTVRLPKAKRRG